MNLEAGDQYEEPMTPEIAGFVEYLTLKAGSKVPVSEILNQSNSRAIAGYLDDKNPNHKSILNLMGSLRRSISDWKSASESIFTVNTVQMMLEWGVLPLAIFESFQKNLEERVFQFEVSRLLSGMEKHDLLADAFQKLSKEMPGNKSPVVWRRYYMERWARLMEAFVLSHTSPVHLDGRDVKYRMVEYLVMLLEQLETDTVDHFIAQNSPYRNSPEDIESSKRTLGFYLVHALKRVERKIEEDEENPEDEIELLDNPIDWDALTEADDEKRSENNDTEPWQKDPDAWKMGDGAA